MVNNVENLGQVPRDSQLSIKIQQLVPHKTQGELHKPQVTPLRLPAEGEQEAAEVVVMAEGTSGIVELPMEVANVDEMVVGMSRGISRLIPLLFPKWWC